LTEKFIVLLSHFSKISAALCILVLQNQLIVLHVYDKKHPSNPLVQKTL